MNHVAAFVLRIIARASDNVPWNVWLTVPVGCARSTLLRAANAYDGGAR